MKDWMGGLFVVSFLMAVGAAVLPAQERYDLVLAGGRVLDPESGLDAVMNVGIRDGRIVTVTEGSIEGARTIDVAGLVVAPGFVDLHAHGQDLVSSQLQARDGVTTALELEGGVFDVDAWYGEREGEAPVNFGATVSHGQARRTVLGWDDWVYGAATDQQIDSMGALLARGLDQGALGVGYGIQYTPGARREEITRLFSLAAERGATSFVHVRYAGLVEPGSSAEAIHEMIANAAGTGASVHIVHIGSSGLLQVPYLLDLIDGARANGIDVTTEVYPYTAASTNIRAAIFDPGWRTRLGADYGDIEWVETGERLDSASFMARREEGGMIIAHVIPESSVTAALGRASVMVASDGVPFVDGRAHPRGAGTFARVLGRYVREQGALSLMEALRKMTLLPAQRLEAYVPHMAEKGRLRQGADADITVFDPQTVIDRATFADPDQPSRGIRHVIVGGTFVVQDGELIEDARPGRAIRRAPATF
jgi:N-acyl-D-aspartate/D-glutamate deacylase